MWDPRIVGGENVTIEEFPYQVSIRVHATHYCGGSILNEDTILTAAHCSDRPIIQYSVHAGTNDLHAESILHVVKRKIVHVSYNVTTNNSLVNDIALFKIYPPIKYSETQKPIKLPRQDQSTPAGSMAVVSGWGTTQEGGGTPHILQKVHLPIVDIEKCKKIYDNQIPEHEICAGYLEGGKGVCHGDSGGALVVEGVQVGIVSWGVGCAVPKYPALFTEVSAYINWISEKIGS